MINSQYNVSPSQYTPIVISENNENNLKLMQWGLTPSANTLITEFRPINIRSESVDEKINFKPLFLEKRCIIPVDGFYEWKVKGYNKIPYYFHRSNQLISFAGLYSSFNLNGKEIASFAILTTRCNNLMQPIHDRMPVILEKQNEKIWLNSSTSLETIKSLMKPISDEYLSCYPVSDLVNSAKNDSIDCIKPRINNEKSVDDFF